MKKSSSIVWGLVLVAIGVILGLRALGICDVNMFFDAWWTLFIIIPCFIGLITDDKKTGSIIGLIIGVLLLLGCQNIIKFELAARLIAPIVIVIIGLSILFKNMFNGDINKSIKDINSKNESKEEYCATFSGQNIKLDKEEFKGTKLNAVFGGLKLDLSNTTIKKDVVINASAIFGGIDIIVPDNVAIKIKSNSIFGGVSNKTVKKDDKKKVTVYINATCLFGGVDIK